MPLRNKSNMQTLDPTLMKTYEKGQGLGQSGSQQELHRCVCMEKKESKGVIPVVDHLHKKNCQLCGAFIINTEEDDELSRYDSGPKSSSRCDSAAGSTSGRKRKQNTRVKVIHVANGCRHSNKRKTFTSQTCLPVSCIAT